MLDELGPTFVKFGQLLSTRPDVMPPDIIAELRKLQDDVSPVPFAEVERVIEEELGLTVEQAFLDFDETPIAAASIGQVHRATLPTGRPGRREGAAAERAAPDRVRPPADARRRRASCASASAQLDFIDADALVDEFGRSIRQELDYQHEARNAETFRRNFAGDERDRGAAASGGATRPAALLTLDRLEGTHVRDLDLDVLGRRSAPRARLPDDGRVDDDDLPARRSSTATRIRRTSSSSTTAGSGSSTSASRGGSPTRT